MPALVLDSVIYMTLFLVQQALRDAGAGPVELSTTIATYSAVYAVACPVSGALVGARRRPMLLVGLLLVLGDIALLSRAEDLAAFQKLIGALAIGTSLVWPSFQALIAEESPGALRPVRMAIFNESTGSVMLSFAVLTPALRSVLSHRSLD